MKKERAMPRLFTGLEIPDDIALDLQMMQGGIPGARWMDAANFHLTIRFIGDIDGGLAREIDRELAEISFRPFEVTLKGVGMFGGNKPHSLYVGLEESPELRKLHDIHERKCRALGCPSEGRKFTPHVTLARLGLPDQRALQRWIETHNLYRSPPMLVRSFALFSSRPLRGGGPYAVEASYGLQEFA
jgi:RNA 2',3'-cyclic 3'-phosphodiesterase